VNISQSLQLLVILSTLLFGYRDNDIDGVDDAVDLCPNTSFDQLVDADGCPEGNPYYGEFTLQIGNEINFDEFSNKTDNYNFFTNYQYRKWGFSLSNSQQTSIDSNNNRSRTTGDVYLTGGYLFSTDSIQTKLILGSKIATADETVGTGENDYTTALHLIYPTNEKQTMFTHVSYTFTGDSSMIDYKNSFGYTFGTSYMLSSNYYTALSYNHAESIYTDGEAYESISLFNSYKITDDIFMSLNYTKGLDRLSYEHSVSVSFGVHLE